MLEDNELACVAAYRGRRTECMKPTQSSKPIIMNRGRCGECGDWAGSALQLARVVAGVAKRRHARKGGS